MCLIANLNSYTIPISICALVAGLAGNVSACTVILRTRSMYNLTHFYLLSLSISDMLLLITGIFQHFHDDTDNSIISRVAVYADDWIFVTSMNASILTVTAFTVERYIAICHPFVAQSLPTTSRAKKIIINIWIMAALLALPPVVINNILNETKDFDLIRMIIKVMPYIGVIRSVLYFFIPMTVITVMYVLIGIRLRKRSGRMCSRHKHATGKPLKMFAFIIFIFFLSWAPYYTLNTMFTNNLIREENIYYHIMDCLYVMMQFTYFLSPTLNPVIYTMMSKKFREALKDLLSKTRNSMNDWTSSFIKTQTVEVNLETA